VYERTVEGEPLEFGVSGQLYNSDLLMYDRTTDSRWEQISGIAVIGEYAGERLEYYPSQMMTWAEWQQAYPESEVLSRFTGHQRDYDGEPYAAYFESEELWFDVNALSTQLFAKEYVAGVELPDGGFAAYLERDVAEHNVLNDAVGNTNLLVATEPDSATLAAVFDRDIEGRTLTFTVESNLLVDEETGTRWDFGGLAVEGELAGAELTPIRWLRLFWFAWVAFHPETELRRPE
jgi:hypothetical protein